MLSPDHVRARRKGGLLTITPLKSQDRALLLDYASRCLTVLRRSSYQKRESINEQLSDLIVPAHLQRVAEGLKKLLFDRCDFQAPDQVDPLVLRQAVFTEASKQRQALKEGEILDRDALFHQVSVELGLELFQIEDLLFGDLKSEHRLMSFDDLDPRVLLDLYDLAQDQAILIRASELTVFIRSDQSEVYRYFFRQLKFRRLLFTLNPVKIDDPSQGYHIEISGPYHLFKSSTKYGMQLALLLPALRRCTEWTLEAKIYWGKTRVPLNFYTQGQFLDQFSYKQADFPEELNTFLTRLKKDKTLWKARRTNKIINLPGVGVCIPDLTFTHPDVSKTLYLEMMGYWSRDAVWKRVELVESGLSEHIIFAVSTRLRVSESVLDDDLPSALFVYKGSMMVKPFVALLDRLSNRLDDLNQDS